METVIETKEQGNTLTMKIIDVRGQRNERKKWMHCFEDVNAIVFVVDVSCYSEHLEEDISTNNLNESIKIFDMVVNSKKKKKKKLFFYYFFFYFLHLIR